MQPELPLQSEPKSQNTSHELNALLAWLRGKSRWSTSKEIHFALGYSPRKIRHLVTASEALIISAPGSSGYKHILDATPIEVSEITSRLTHMAKGMVDRANKIRREYHQSIH